MDILTGITSSIFIISLVFCIYVAATNNMRFKLRAQAWENIPPVSIKFLETTTEEVTISRDSCEAFKMMDWTDFFDNTGIPFEQITYEIPEKNQIKIVRQIKTEDPELRKLMHKLTLGRSEDGRKICDVYNMYMYVDDSLVKERIKEEQLLMEAYINNSVSNCYTNAKQIENEYDKFRYAENCYDAYQRLEYINYEAAIDQGVEALLDAYFDGVLIDDIIS